MFYSKLIEQTLRFYKIKNLENRAKNALVIGDLVRLVIIPSRSLKNRVT